MATLQAAAEEEGADSFRALIKSRNWRSAVFTTFTLSLTFFESHVLPQLRKQGCQDITIYADEMGYRDSLAERRASAVGRDYALLPVSVAGKGIFHPKLIHLTAETGDDDLLLVGSGNLTLPGHGGNVEVLEVLTANRAAAALLQACEFFRDLASHPRIHTTDNSALLASSARLLDVASRGENHGTCHFIHSLRLTGSEQFESLARHFRASWNELLVLSPYHHPEGTPIKALLERTKTSRLVVGVSSKEPTKSAFPVGRPEFRKYRPSAVMPEAQKGHTRRLHAKWFELRAPRMALTLTGSFNATRESFGTTVNVECGVMRLHDVASDCWSEVELPDFEQQTFPRENSAHRFCIAANLVGSERIKGTLIGHPSPSGTWSLSLESEDAQLHCSDVELTADGTFECRTSAAGRHAQGESGALQLILTRGSDDARGWLQFDEYRRLSFSLRTKLAISRKFSQAGEDDADSELMMALVFAEVDQLTGHRAQPASASKAKTHPLGAPPAEKHVFKGLTLEEFEALAAEGAGKGEPFDGSLLLASLQGQDNSIDALRQYLRSLIGITDSEGAGEAGENLDPTEEDDPAGNETKKKRRGSKGTGKRETGNKAVQQGRTFYERQQDEFKARHQSAHDAFARAASEEARVNAERARAFLFVASWLIAVRVRFHATRNVEQLLTFLQQWLRETSQLRLPLQQKEVISEMFCGTAAVVALYQVGNAGLSNTHLARLRSIAALAHTFFDGHESQQTVVRLARAYLETPRGRDIAQGNAPAALEALRQALQIPAPRRLVKEALDAPAANIRDLENKLGDPTTVQLLRTVRAARQNTSVGLKSSRYSAVSPLALRQCPSSHCGVSLTRRIHPSDAPDLESEIKWRLHYYGLAKCLQCSHILVYVEGS